MIKLYPYLIVVFGTIHRAFDGRNLSSTGDAIAEPVERRLIPSNERLHI